MPATWGRERDGALPLITALRLLLCASLLILPALALPALALPTANFDASLRPRTGMWQDEDRVLNLESPAQQSRPVWVHAGDSLATGWANGSTLHERLSATELSEPAPTGGTADLAANLPVPDLTWYAGRRWNGGLLGFLDQLSAGNAEPNEWVVFSSALVGSLISNVRRNDPLRVPLKSRDRVRLVTISIGGNDICQNLDPARDATSLTQRIQDFRAGFSPRARYVAWDLPRIAQMREKVFARLRDLPPSVGRDRTLRYCKKMWNELACPAFTTESSETLTARRDALSAVLAQNFGPLFSLDDETRDMDVLDLFAGDCFHPSRLVQERIVRGLSRVLKSDPSFAEKVLRP